MNAHRMYVTCSVRQTHVMLHNYIEDELKVVREMSATFSQEGDTTLSLV